MQPHPCTAKLPRFAHGFRERPDIRYGLTALCVGMGMGAAVLWDRA